MFAFLLFMIQLSLAAPPSSIPTDYQDVKIYVDLSHVMASDGSSGTSTQLNVIISDQSQRTGMLLHKLSYHSNPGNWRGDIRVYDWSNVQYMDSYRP